MMPASKRKDALSKVIQKSKRQRDRGSGLNSVSQGEHGPFCTQEHKALLRWRDRNGSGRAGCWHTAHSTLTKHGVLQLDAQPSQTANDQQGWELCKATRGWQSCCGLSGDGGRSWEAFFFFPNCTALARCVNPCQELNLKDQWSPD